MNVISTILLILVVVFLIGNLFLNKLIKLRLKTSKLKLPVNSSSKYIHDNVNSKIDVLHKRVSYLEDLNKKY